MARLTSPSLLELDLGMELALIIGPTTEDPFSDEDLRIAWQHHRARMMEQYCRRPGQRPWGWWFFEAGREEHLTPYPLRSEFEGTAEERVDALIEYDIEPWFSSPRTATSGMTSWRRCESEPTRPSCGSAPAASGSRAASRGVRVLSPTTAGTWSSTRPSPRR
jgi:hypothetical protein